MCHSYLFVGIYSYIIITRDVINKLYLVYLIAILNQDQVATAVATAATCVPSLNGVLCLLKAANDQVNTIGNMDWKEHGECAPEKLDEQLVSSYFLNA